VYDCGSPLVRKSLEIPAAADLPTGTVVEPTAAASILVKVNNTEQPP
jgi:hypothetical protein